MAKSIDEMSEAELDAELAKHSAPSGASAGKSIDDMSEAELDAELAKAKTPSGSTFTKLVRAAENPLGSMANAASSAITNYFQNNKGKESSTAEKLQTGLENYGNTATAGYLPHLQAATHQTLDLITPEALKTDYFKSQTGKDYGTLRDENIAREKELTANNPKSADVGKATGVLAQILALKGAPTGAGLVPEGTGYLAKVASGMAKGAIPMAELSALANPGDKQGVVDPLQLAERGSNALTGAKQGAEFGGALSALLEMPTLAKSLKDAGAQKTFYATRPYKGDVRRYAPTPEQQKALGEAAIKNDVTGWMKNPHEITEAAGEKLDETGTKFGAMLDDLDTQLKRKTGQYMPEAPGSTVDAPRVGVDMQTVTDSMKQKLYDDTIHPDSMKHNERVNQFMNDMLNNQTGPILDVKQAQALKQKADLKANWTKNVRRDGALTTDEMLNRELSQHLKSGIETSGDAAINYLGADLPKDWVNQFQGVKKDYGNLKKLESISDNRSLGETANRTFGLSDYLAAAAGAAAEGPAGLALGGINRYGRLYGNQIAGRSLYNAGKVAEKLMSPQAREVIQQAMKANPNAMPVSVWNLLKNQSGSH